MMVAGPAGASLWAADPPSGAPRSAAVETVTADAAFREAARSVVCVVGLRPADGSVPNSTPSWTMASGLVYDDAGHVVTNATAITGCREIRVYAANRSEALARVIGVDPFTGLGVLQIEPGFAPPLRRGDPTRIREGEFVLTLGFTQGFVPVSRTGRITWRYGSPARSLFQMTNVVQPGNAGGAAVDREGRLLGLIVGELGTVDAEESYSRRATERGRAFAVPVDELDELVSEIVRTGGTTRGYLGVRIEQGRVVDPMRPDEPFEVGVSITEVLPEGPAWQAGLRPGDLVVAIDGEPVNSPEELMEEVQRRPVGSDILLVWVRSEERHEARVALANAPDSLLLSIFESIRAATRSRARLLSPTSPGPSR
jgi:S1-C subfamily serine protease